MLVSLPVGRIAPPLALSLLSAALTPSVNAQGHEPVDELIVTGVPRDRASNELAQSVTVVAGDELDRARAATLGETLANQLGVSSTYFGAGASRPIIRGLTGARVQILEDGIDAMDAATLSDDHAVTIEPLAADQVEIFRGPTTLLYGSGAVGGVVNTVTARVPARAPDGLTGSVELRGDSAADARGAAVRLDGGGRRFAWHFDAGRRDSGDYEIPGFARAHAEREALDEPFGVLPNSGAESSSAAVGASWLHDDGFLGLGVKTFDTVYGIPGHAHHDDEAGDGAAAHVPVRIDLDQRRIDLRGDWQGLTAALDGLTVQIGINDYEHLELEGDAVGTRFSNDAAELRLELLHRPVGRWSGAFGLHLAERDFEAVGDEAFVPSVATSATGLFVVEQLELPQWEISLGGRVEEQRHSPAASLRPFAGRATSVSLGGVRALGGSRSFVATVALADRLPVAEELYSDGPHLASGIVQRGDAALGEETARHVDVGVRGDFRRGSWSVTAFRTRYDDFIYLAASGAVDDEHELPIFAYTQADADFAGLESEVFLALSTEGANELDLRLFADYVRGELASGAALPRLPPLRYGARLEYHRDRLLFGVEGTRYAEQDEVAPFERATPGYTLLNADARWRLAGVTRAEVELFVNASNLGDEEARKHTSFVKDVAPLPGRNYAVGIRSRF